ncbi:FtsX-like permease family protein [Actinomadura viridis]|uniref:ABC transport system permease protein n=1 Tax=Actinomadura viridis TaxID=58110 RepID=A0A931DGA8_9ACTN|nr:ABC transporter permease [Actinomadura viridis]MBG6086213.1 putative ABC transport system permease protein [Actinomadura viridis]
MLKTTLAGLLARKVRLLLTAVAITLGVGFIAGTFVLTDTMDAGVQKTFARSAGKVDVAVLPRPGNKDGLPADLLARIRAVPGVVEAQGIVQGDAALLGRDGKAVGDVPTLGVSITGGRLLRHEFEKGRAPAGPAEAVLDARVAERERFGVGDTITVLDARDRPHRFTVVGLLDVGLDAEASRRGAVGFDAATAARMTGERTYREIDVAGAGRAAIARAVGGGGHEVLTGARLADRLAAEAGADTKIIRTGLLLFGLVAMLVSALVIYNTFAILIAQRMREMALLRCVGATRRQIFGGVLAESAVVGLVGSVLGLAAGLGLGAGVLALLDAFGVSGPGAPEMPPGDASLAPRTVLVGLAVGTVVTVLAALLPARAATRVAPVTALRADLEPGSARFRLGRVRTVLAVLLGTLGGAGVVLGSVVLEKGPAAMYAVAAAGALVFLAVIAVMPALVRPLSRLVGALPGRVAGVPGRLAVQNARRSPRRTATTTIALTIGVGLMSLFAVVAASSKASSERQLDTHFPVDFVIHPQLNRVQGVPHALAERLRGRPELGAVIEQRERAARVAGRQGGVTSITESALGTVIKPEFESGSLKDLRPGGALLDVKTARERNLRVGQVVTVEPLPRGPRPGEAAGRTGEGARPGTGARPDGTGPDGARPEREGAPVRLRIAGIFGGDVPMTGLVVTGADFERLFAATDPARVYVKAAGGISAAAARKAVDDAARPYPTAKVASAAEIREEFSGAIDTVLMIFAGLLGLAIVIALFGIANTLTLSVVERTRESALLRALGLTRGQLRRMLSVEALVMAVIGALTGVVLGVGFGWAATRAMDDDAVVALPYLRIAGFMVLAAAAGMLAAVLPARRAARASIVASLSQD